MTTYARLALVLSLSLLAGSACSDSKSHDVEPGSQSALPRPKLERPPTSGLPADLRPPR